MMFAIIAGTAGCASPYLLTVEDAVCPVGKKVRLIGKLDPETIDHAHAGAWAKAVADDEAKLESVLAEEEAVACDRAAAFA